MLTFIKELFGESKEEMQSKLEKEKRQQEREKRHKEFYELVELGKKYLPIPEDVDAEIGWVYYGEWFKMSPICYLYVQDKSGNKWRIYTLSASSVDELKEKIMNPDVIEELKNNYIVQRVNNENPIDFCKNCAGYKAGKCSKYLNVVDGTETECESNRKNNTECFKYVPNSKLVNAMKKKIKFKTLA